MQGKTTTASTQYENGRIQPAEYLALISTSRMCEAVCHDECNIICNEDSCLLDCITMQSGRSSPTFQRSFLPPPSEHFITLMMEEARASEVLVNFYHITQHYNPEHCHFCTHSHKNLKS
jgi:hypothetical protein